MKPNQSLKEDELIKAATALAMGLNQAVDDNLPEKLAGIVKLHAGIAVGCILVPIPGAGLLAAGANTWTMYVRINKEIELPFAENIIRSVALGVLTNLGTNAVAALGIGVLLKTVPGLGTFASYAVMSATVYALTIAAGYIYMTALAKLLSTKKPGEVEQDDLKVAVNEVMDDKESIQTIFKTAKEGYTEADSDLSPLAQELSELKQEMQKNAATSEQIDAVGEIAAAEMFAQRNNASKTFKRLKKAGEKAGDWALESAKKLELSLAAAALRTVIRK